MRTDPTVSGFAHVAVEAKQLEDFRVFVSDSPTVQRSASREPKLRTMTLAIVVDVIKG
jgi:hypothetical protein